VSENRSHPATLDPRRAGQVTRYHTWPRLREQSVAEHSWQVARILLVLLPDVRREVLVHAMVHDVGEVVTGDAPYPIKASSPTLKSVMDQLERDAHLAMSTGWRLPPPQALTTEEHNLFKLAEYVEMWEWGLGELELGNSGAALVASRCFAKIEEMAELVPEVRARLASYLAKRRDQHDRVVSTVSLV
jgi:5'-deoxynucleotidase YfbR-like HD superfamily hydrolase